MLISYSEMNNFVLPREPATHERKQVSKLPGKAFCSTVSSRVRRSFPENFATQGREENICNIWYFLPRVADSAPCAVNVWIGQINQLAIEIGLHAQVISKLKKADTLLSEIRCSRRSWSASHCAERVIGEGYISLLLRNEITWKYTCLVLWEKHTHMTPFNLLW